MNLQDPAQMCVYLDKLEAEIERLREDNTRLRAALDTAHNMLAAGHPYGHIAALLAGAIKGGAVSANLP